MHQSRCNQTLSECLPQRPEDGPDKALSPAVAAGPAPAPEVVPRPRSPHVNMASALINLDGNTDLYRQVAEIPPPHGRRTACGTRMVPVLRFG